MCLGIPMQVKEITGDMGIVEINGVRRNVCFTLLEDVHAGDYVLIHAGFAIQKISEEDAMESLKLINELDLSSSL